jgi:DNA replication protein DnaC
MDYIKALNLIVNRRSDALSKADAFFHTLMSSNSEFCDLEKEIRVTELEYARNKEKAEKLSALYDLKRALILKLGVKDDLYPPYNCLKCKDTGRRENGEFCECVKRLAFSQSSDNLEIPLHSFNEINPALFNETDREIFLKTAVDLSILAQKGETAVRKNINLLGKTGTGKTFLASCFAEKSSSLGKTVMFITAFSFVERALSYHTTFDERKSSYLSPLLDCDVLIVDDLGTESIFKNVTLEYLYHIINERQLKGKTTFITSNLTIDEFAVRYGERIASRLFDKRLCYTREFNFGDVRKIKI